MPFSADLPSPPAPAFRVSLRGAAREVVATMLLLEALVVLLDVWLTWGQGVASPALQGVFDAAREGGLGSWIGVTQTVLVALSVGAVAAVHRRRGAPGAAGTGWTVLAALVAYLAFDDGVGFHERVGTAFAEAGGGALVPGFPSYYWQLTMGPLFAAAGVFLLVFLWRALPARRLRAAVVGALALFALAVALDFVEGLAPDHPLNLYAHVAATEAVRAQAPVLFGRPAFDTVVHLGKVLEEVTEMAAMTVLWGVFLSHLAALVPVLTVGAESSGGAERGRRRSGRRVRTSEARPVGVRSAAPQPGDGTPAER